MSRTVFYVVLGLVSLVVVASMLPNRFYEANDRQFMWATIVTCVIMLIALVLVFEVL